MATPQGVPNLFDFATSELSQDAVVAWLLAWSDTRFAGADPQLHAAASKMLDAMFAAPRRDDMGFADLASRPPRGCTVTVQTQKHRIDVLARVDGPSGEPHWLLIEDKVATGPHSDQLAKYPDTLVEKEARCTRDAIIPIYLKTYPQSSYRKVDEAGYGILHRETLLEILGGYSRSGGKNAIAIQYLEYLKNLDEDLGAYATLPITASWSRRTWMGFVDRLSADLRGRSEQLQPGWGYVANPRGGFWGLWWGWTPWGERDREHAYLQLQNLDLDASLHFKIRCPDKSGRSAARKSFHKALEEVAWRRMALKKPRWRSGATMTVMVAEFEKSPDYRVPDAVGRIDMDATMKRLLEAESILAAAVSVMRRDRG